MARFGPLDETARLPVRVLAAVLGGPRTEPELHHLGSPAAVAAAIDRLVARGSLVRRGAMIDLVPAVRDRAMDRLLAAVRDPTGPDRASEE